MIKVPGICTAPQYVAEELLRAEGFSEVQYVPREGAAAISPGLAAAEIDLNLHFAAPLIIQVDQGDPVVPADTVRFYALRLQEAGMIRASPQKILAQGTDWRFLNELRQELKG